MRVAVVGGGVIGLSVAWRLAVDGHRVDVFDDAPGRAASYAAAGMLAPAGEAWFGDETLVRLGVESLRRWPDFAAQLSEASGVDVGLRREGTVLVSADEADAATLDQVHGLLERHGLDATRLTRRELREVEPGLAPGLRRAIRVGSELSVDNRRVLDALRTALAGRDATLRPERADLDSSDGGGGPGVRGRTSGDVVAADAVVVAPGAELTAVAGLPAELGGAVRPVKGQILRLRSDRALLTHTVRGLVRGDPFYVVPRTDGELVVGATSEEMGADVRVTGDGVYELLRRAIAVVPGLRECELTEAMARGRPGTPDNLPLIGPAGAGVHVATGHYRGGFLLAPLTAEAIAASIVGRPAPDPIAACAPDRFGFAHSPSVAGAENQQQVRKTAAAAHEEGS